MVKDGYSRQKLNRKHAIYCLQILLLIASVLYLLMFLFVAFNRIGYPYELEWMEGGMVDHVIRVMEGRPLYTEPSLEFIPFLYTPFYYYLSSCVSTITGVGFMPLRLVSFVSTLICFLLIFHFVYRATNSWFCGMLALGMFAASFSVSGYWFDLARNDALFLALVLGSLYCLYISHSTIVLILAGLLMGLAFFTKQTALFPALAMCMYCIVDCQGWRKLFFPITFALCAGGSVVILHIVTQGWSSYYVFVLPQEHLLLYHKLLTFLWNDLIGVFALPFFLTLYCTYQKYHNKNNQHVLFLIFSVVGMLVASGISRMHFGGYDNVLMYSYAMLSIGFGLGLHEVLSKTFLRNRIQKVGKNHIKDCIHQTASIWLLVSMACLIQFMMLIYNPFSCIPQPTDQQAGDRLINQMKNTKNDVFLPYHGYLPRMAGKQTYAHFMAIIDILRCENQAMAAKLMETIDNSIQEQKFELIIMDDTWLRQKIKKHYQIRKPIFTDPKVFYPVTGLRVRPEFCYVAK